MEKVKRNIEARPRLPRPHPRVSSGRAGPHSWHHPSGVPVGRAGGSPPSGQPLRTPCYFPAGCSVFMPFFLSAPSSSWAQMQLCTEPGGLPAPTLPTAGPKHQEARELLPSGASAPTRAQGEFVPRPSHPPLPPSDTHALSTAPPGHSPLGGRKAGLPLLTRNDAF